MNGYVNVTNTFPYQQTGPCGGLRSFSFADWAWENIMSAIGWVENPDALWELVFADLEGEYFANGYAEMPLPGSNFSVIVEHESDISGESDMNYLLFVEKGNILLEVVAESDGETNATSGISVLCNELWNNTH